MPASVQIPEDMDAYLVPIGEGDFADWPSKGSARYAVCSLDGIPRIFSDTIEGGVGEAHARGATVYLFVEQKKNGRGA